MSEVRTLLKEALQYVVLRPQLLIALLLVIVIPVSFLLSGQNFLEAGRYNQDKLQRDRVAMLHDSLALLMKQELPKEELAGYLTTIVDDNPDITRLRIVEVVNGDYVVTISVPAGTEDEVIEDPTPYSYAAVQREESVLFESYVTGARGWLAIRPVERSDKQFYYIESEHDFRNVDTYIARAEQQAYIWLLLVLAIGVALAWWNISQINYLVHYRETKRQLDDRDRFTNMVVHELRTPLTAMRGYASMIEEDTASTPSIINYASIVRKSTERLLALVTDLLDIASLQSGKLVLTIKEVTLKSVVQSVVSELQPLASAKNLTLIANVGDREVVLGDQVRLQQILTNVVSNALKYTKAGSVTIAVATKKSAVEIRIADTGMGIAAEDQAKLFAPFFRVATKETEEIIGTGLGMWITKELIAQMKGTVAVESIQGVGTHVVIKLPRPAIA